MACAGNKQQRDNRLRADNEKQSESRVTFNADSAYNFIAKQVDFGPRVPGNLSHASCAEWLTEQLGKTTDTVFIQTASAVTFNGDNIPIKNIMGSLNPEHNKRILFLAHYDTRPWADAETDDSKIFTPIAGANDGASGVGILLELSRILKVNGYSGGVDFLFVDAEDYGESQYIRAKEENNVDSWCLGTQYWVENQPEHISPPVFAILLDMVGGKNARFHREYFSHVYAGDLVDYVWNIAGKEGFGNVFINEPGNPITDDHFYLLRKGIPAIDIIENKNPMTGSFNQTWHTLDDNMDNIDKNTIHAVGVTLQKLIETINQ